VLLVSVGWVLVVRVWMIGLAPVLGPLSRPAPCVCGVCPCFDDDGSDHGCFGVVPIPASGCVLCVCLGSVLAVWVMISYDFILMGIS
jgi:hypothetical protein